MSSIKHGIHVGKSSGIPCDFGFMAETEFAADLASALVVAKQNDFNIWMQKLPAFQCVALNDRGMSAEGLGRSEECDHLEKRSLGRSSPGSEIRIGCGYR